MKRKELAKISLPLAMVEAVDAAYAKIPKVACKGLCVGCCAPVGDCMTDFERDRITKAAKKRPNGKEDRDKMKPCNMLIDGRCSVYAIRPAICRIWGVDKKMPCPHGCEGSATMPSLQG